jgi:hypothetical protein
MYNERDWLQLAILKKVYSKVMILLVYDFGYVPDVHTISWAILIDQFGNNYRTVLSVIDYYWYFVLKFWRAQLTAYSLFLLTAMPLQSGVLNRLFDNINTPRGN